MKCIYCGTELPQGGHFCPGCGQKAPVQSVPQPSVSTPFPPASAPPSPSYPMGGADEPTQRMDLSEEDFFHSYIPPESIMPPTSTPTPPSRPAPPPASDPYEAPHAPAHRPSDVPSAPSPKKEEPPKKDGSRAAIIILIIAISVAFLTVLGVLAYYFIFNSNYVGNYPSNQETTNDSEKEEKTEKPTEEPTDEPTEEPIDEDELITDAEDSVDDCMSAFCDYDFAKARKYMDDPDVLSYSSYSEYRTAMVDALMDSNDSGSRSDWEAFVDAYMDAYTKNQACHIIDSEYDKKKEQVTCTVHMTKPEIDDISWSVTVDDDEFNEIYHSLLDDGTINEDSTEQDLADAIKSRIFQSVQKDVAAQIAAADTYTEEAELVLKQNSSGKWMIQTNKSDTDIFDVITFD